MSSDQIDEGGEYVEGEEGEYDDGQQQQQQYDSNSDPNRSYSGEDSQGGGGTGTHTGSGEYEDAGDGYDDGAGDGQQDDGQYEDEGAYQDGDDDGEGGQQDGAEGEEEYDEDEDDEDADKESPEAILGSMLKPGGVDASAADASDMGASGAAGAFGKSSFGNLDDDLDTTQEGELAVFQELQQTLQSLAEQTDAGDEDPTISRLKGDFDKLHRLFVNSRKSEKSLIKKCRELTAELSANASKVQAALKLSQNDRSTIASLRKEVKKAWKMVEAAAEKEGRAKDVVTSLKNEVESLRSAMAEQGITPQAAMPTSNNFARNKLVELQMEQEDQLRRVTKEKQNLEQELANSSSEIRSLRIEAEELKEKVSSLLSERGLMDEEMLTLKDLLASKKTEQDRDIRSREKMEQMLKQTTEAWEKRESEMKMKAGEAKSLRDQIARFEMQLQNERLRVEKSEKERDTQGARLQRLQQDYDDQSLTTQRLLNENHEQSRDLKAREEDFSRLKDNFKMISRVKETLTKKLKASDENKMNAEMERDALRSTNSHLNHDLETLHKEYDQTKKQLEMASRERDIAQKNFVKATSATQKQFNTLKLAEQTQRNLEQEIQSYKDEAQKMRKLIYTLEKDRDNKINEASRLDQIIMAKDEEMKMKDMIIFDSKKKIIEFERKLKEQQALYENVRADRNVYSKNLIESQDEITEMKRKLKIMNHQVEQLKEEIASKEAVLVKEHFEHSKLEKEKEALSIQIGKLQQQYEEAQQMIQNQQAEENKLRHIITEADAERLRQKKEYDAVVQERDILGTQLIRRNDELSLLYEKIKIQTSTLNKGEIQYRERLEDIRVLRLEIKRLRREKASSRPRHRTSTRDVLRERTRVKVLEEELESPMNIHRWRKLAGSDPSTYELITKIQTLQKRLIAKTEEVVEKELVIQQKEKLYKEVKEVLQRQPGPEVVEELRVVRDAVKTKMRECKALASELNMYHSQVNEYKYEIERLSRELQDLKKKYYQLRKKHQADKRAEANTLKERVLLPLGMDRLPYTAGAAEALYGHPGDDGLGSLPPGGGGGGANGAFPPSKSHHVSRAGTTDMRPVIRANVPAGPRFSGGGFNMSTGPHQVVHLVPDGQEYRLHSHGGGGGGVPPSSSSHRQVSAVSPSQDPTTPLPVQSAYSGAGIHGGGAIGAHGRRVGQGQPGQFKAASIGHLAGQGHATASQHSLHSQGSLAQSTDSGRGNGNGSGGGNGGGGHDSNGSQAGDSGSTGHASLSQPDLGDKLGTGHASVESGLPRLPGAESKDQLRSTQSSLVQQGLGSGAALEQSASDVGSNRSG
ncbi:hypothetical protein BC831DRAFT_476871 [Entophlyctis helioformis]|nr:hypothetical protein BC831DRAFT_476871 [Entophlyctis helioformis]